MICVSVCVCVVRAVRGFLLAWMVGGALGV